MTIGRSCSSIGFQTILTRLPVRHLLPSRTNTTIMRYPASVTSSSYRRAMSSSSSSSLSNEVAVDDYFQVLGVERSFSISPTQLKSNYRKLMTQYHPDKQHHQQDDATTTTTTTPTTASQVTHAYETLKQYHTRASHLLELQQHQQQQQQQSASFDPESTNGTELVGTEFLMEIMELQEDIYNACPTKLSPVYQMVQNRVQDTCHKLNLAFENQEYDRARTYTAMLQYWNRIEQLILDKMEEEEFQEEEEEEEEEEEATTTAARSF